MTKYDEKARDLQRTIWMDEVKQADEGPAYDEELRHLTTAHARGDIVLLVSYLSSLNAQTAVVCGLLWVVVALLTYAVLR